MPPRGPRLAQLLVRPVGRSGGATGTAYNGGMSGLPLETRFTNAPQSPVTEGARDEVSGLLNQAYASGELELLDYQRLLDEAYAAKTNADLVPVARALPARLSATQPTLGGDNYGPPGEVPPLNSLVEAKAAAKQMMRSQAWALGVGAGAVVVALVVLLLILL